MNRNEAMEKAKTLVSQMTVEELASQLRYDAFSVERLNIPSYNWWNEALHGVAREGTATSFPQEIAQGASFDRELVHEIGNICAIEGRAKYNAYKDDGDHSRYKGLTFWSPNINIFRDPRWGRGQETYGEDPYLTAQLGCSFIKGMQRYRGGYMTAAACAKHFAVHSGPEALRHEFNACASEKDLQETYLPAFEACVKEAEVEAVMGAYNRTNGEVCCASEYLMNKLRGEWGLNYGDTDTVKLEIKNISYADAAQNGIDIGVTVKNDGKYDVSEVVQVYVKVKSDNEVPNRKLAAFERTMLRAGEQKTLTIHIDKLAFTTVNDKGERNADGTGAVIYAGCNPDKIITREI